MLRVIFVLLLLPLIQACSRPELNPLPEDGVILAFGDSLTVGVGASPKQSYPSVLAELSGRKVMNAGVSGEVTAKGVSRLGRLLDEERVDLLILLEGGNDILRNLKRSDTKQNLATMIQQAKRYGIDVVLIGVPEKKLFSDAAAIYDELAEEYSLVYERELIADLLRSPKYKSDPIHLNAKGYKKLAEDIYSTLQKRGALRQ